MKTVAKFVLWVFASIGVLYVAVLIYSWTSSPGARVDSTHGLCAAKVWASQISASLEQTIGHVVVGCSDESITHYLVIADGDEQLIYATPNQIIFSKEYSVGHGNESDLSPLTIKWLSSNKAELIVPDGFERNIGPLNGIEMIVRDANEISP